MNIMIVGVGGQGTLLASKILGTVFTKKGYNVKVSEVHGMSQRGGSVVTYVKAEKDKPVAAPIIDFGEADYILAFEKLEAARNLPYLRIGGKIVVNDLETDPMPVISGVCAYPENLVEKMQAKGAKVECIPAQELSAKAGSGKAVNVALIGYLSKSFDYPEEDWLDALRENVKPQFVEMNEKAFRFGREYK